MKNMKKFNGLSIGERAKVIGDSWSKLTSEQKQQYVDLAAEDKQRYQNECKQLEKKGYFINKEGVNSKDLQKTKDKGQKKRDSSEKKDVVLPKRPMSAFFFFGNSNRAALNAKNPDLKITEIAKMNGEQWAKLTPEQKAPFDKMNADDILRHEKETKQLKDLGYFINSDGVKSTMLSKKGKVMDFEAGTVMPKKVGSGYIFFFREYHADKKNTT